MKFLYLKILISNAGLLRNLTPGLSDRPVSNSSFKHCASSLVKVSVPDFSSLPKLPERPIFQIPLKNSENAQLHVPHDRPDFNRLLTGSSCVSGNTESFFSMSSDDDSSYYTYSNSDYGLTVNEVQRFTRTKEDLNRKYSHH